MNRRRLSKGNVIYQPVKRPHHEGNPIPDPLGRRRVGREFDPIDIHEIRKIFSQTRGEFAAMLGISKETLRNWERGRRYPRGPARSLLRIARADPDVVAAVLVRHRARWVARDPADTW